MTQTQIGLFINIVTLFIDELADSFFKFVHVLWDREGYGPCMWFSHDAANITAVDFYPGIFACGESDAECKANNMDIFVD